MAIWGIDLGGTKIEAVVLSDNQSAEVLCRHRISTEADEGYEHVINRIDLLINEVADKYGERPEKIGVGTPGTMDPISGTLKNPNTTALNGKPFQQDLAKKLGIPVMMANDANCFALAETRIGIVRDEMPDARMVFGVIMGTGVGGGLVIDGKVWNGRQGIAGEWGHNFLDESGGKCYCGKIGCVEKVISGKNLELHHKDTYGEEKKLKQIYEEHLEGGHPDSTATIERLLHFYGKGIASVINVLDPDVIVLGGGVGNIDLLYSEGVEKIKDYVFNPRVDTVILKPKLGDSAGVFGAAFLSV